MHHPQIGDIWEYTFDPNVLPQYKDEYKTVCHILVLDILDRDHQLCLGYFIESGYKSEIVMLESRNMSYRKVA